MRTIFHFLFSFCFLFVGLFPEEALTEALRKHSSLIVDQKTGYIFHQEAANQLRHPASLTKMMTLYLTFYEIEKKRLSLDTLMKISKKAAKMPRTNLSLKEKETISVKDAIDGLIVHSANDAAVVLAEYISGTEREFAKRMTKVARMLGMYSTTFKNASGLTHKRQKTTAYDIAKLAIALKRDFPQYYKLFNTQSFKFRDRLYTSHNNVTKNNHWIDGLKTGYTIASGFNIASTTNLKGVELVGIILGGNTATERDKKVTSLLKKYVSSYSLEVAEK